MYVSLMRECIFKNSIMQARKNLDIRELCFLHISQNSKRQYNYSWWNEFLLEKTEMCHS